MVKWSVISDVEYEGSAPGWSDSVDGDTCHTGCTGACDEEHEFSATDRCVCVVELPHCVIFVDFTDAICCWASCRCNDWATGTEDDSPDVVEVGDSATTGEGVSTVLS